jgi:hypothetical protein
MFNVSLSALIVVADSPLIVIAGMELSGGLASGVFSFLLQAIRRIRQAGITNLIVR